MNLLGKEKETAQIRGFTYSAFECPIKRGRKNEDAASMTTPRWEKTKPIFASDQARRIAMGRVIVMPIWIILDLFWGVARGRTYADCRPLDRCYSWLPAVVDGECYSPTSVIRISVYILIDFRQKRNPRL